MAAIGKDGRHMITIRFSPAEMALIQRIKDGYGLKSMNGAIRVGLRAAERTLSAVEAAEVKSVRR